jgi:hypothetical protein
MIKSHCANPTLKDNERYKYLVERLVPRPRNPQENIQTGTTKDGASSHKQEKSTVQIDNQNATKEQSHAPIPSKEVEQIEVQSTIPPQENKRESTEAPPVAQENDVHMEDSTNEVVPLVMMSPCATPSQHFQNKVMTSNGCRRK